MDLPATTNDALSRPIRAEIFELLGQMHRPATTGELADRLNRHPNGVRLHLEAMEGAGLLTRDQQRRGRGRPRDIWSISADASPGGQDPSDYADLARWLAGMIGSGDSSPEAVEERGYEIGENLLDGEGLSGQEENFSGAMAGMGFRPRRKPGRKGKVTYCLGNCPYRDVVREKPTLVCNLHRGITRGLLASIDPDNELADFVAKDPDHAGCLVTVTGPITDASRQ